MSLLMAAPSMESRPANRSRRSARTQNPSPPNDQADRPPPTYGYHNTFHTHASPPPSMPPPSYAVANSAQTMARLSAQARAEAVALGGPLPAYTCSIELEGMLSVKQELSSPFQISRSREWQDVYLVLRGTQLSMYRIKSPHVLSKKKSPCPGRLIKSYSLQHAEVGVASDFKKTALIPRSPFAHLIPVSARTKLFETDPHLFEPIREHVLRLRVETEQFLVCTSTAEEMLDWVEALCAAVDISPPLDDRSEPRYRSLPRRNRRQRLLEGSNIAANLDNLLEEDIGRQIIAEQERIIRELYPHLAGADASDSEQQGTTASASANSTPNADPETDDLDPEDVRFPSRTGSRDGGLARPTSHDRPTSSASESSGDPKLVPSYRHSPPQALRYRRRCAPVLLASSPRVSDVVFSAGQRMRINVHQRTLVEYTSHPPRYDAHNFKKPTKRRPVLAPKTTAATDLTRPASPSRGISESSFTSSLNEPFGYDLSASSSEQVGDEIQSVPSSEPPSPIAATYVKADVTRRLAGFGKTRVSDEGARERGFSAVALGVGLMI